MLKRRVATQLKSQDFDVIDFYYWLLLVLLSKFKVSSNSSKLKSNTQVVNEQQLATKKLVT